MRGLFWLRFTYDTPVLVLSKLRIWKRPGRFVRTTVDAATPLWHRQRLLDIDLESGQGGSVSISTAGEAADIVIQAVAPGLAP
jgi:hypothetical protein